MKAKQYSTNDVLRKINKGIDDKYLDVKSSQIREFENLGNGNVQFKYSGGHIDDRFKKVFTSKGFKVSNVHNILDAGHMNIKGKI